MELMLLETHAICFLLIKLLSPWFLGCAEVQLQSFQPIEGSRLYLRYRNLESYFWSHPIFLGNIDPLSQLHFICAGSATLTMCLSNPRKSPFPVMGHQDCMHALKKFVFEASSRKAPAAALETCL